MTPPLVLDLEAVAQLLGLSRSAVLEHTASGALPSRVLPSGRTVWLRNDVDGWRPPPDVGVPVG